MDYTTETLRVFESPIKELVRSDLGQGKLLSVSEMVRRIWQIFRYVARFWMKEWLEQVDGAYPKLKIACPCGGRAEYVRRREAVIITLFGRVSFRRAYYLCPDCHRGRCPLDERLGYQPGCLAPELYGVVGRLGAELPFERAKDLLKCLIGVSLSENSVRAATQGVGEAVMAQEQEWSSASQDLDLLLRHDRLPSEEKPERLYGSIDGVKALVDSEWRELKIGCWYLAGDRPPPEHPPDEIREQPRATNITYYCDLLQAKEFGELLWATGCQRLADQAQEVVFVADGAAWIWKLVQTHFPKAIQIVDWYHAVEYIAPIAQAAFGENTPDSKAWQQRVRTDLWEGRFERVLVSFRSFLDHAQASEAARKALTYYQNNRKRMRYAEFRSKGLRIGSGTVESGCKQIATQRLKVAGAHWTKDGARKTAKARAALLSNQWDTVTARLGCLPSAA